MVNGGGFSKSASEVQTPGWAMRSVSDPFAGGAGRFSASRGVALLWRFTQRTAGPRTAAVDEVRPPG